MRAAELAVRGGVLVLPEGERRADLLIDGGAFAAIVDPGEGESANEIDASALLVLPGMVDAHVHFNDPGRADWEGWEAGSRGAAAGGVTTVVDMPLNSLPPTTTAAALDAKVAAASRASLVDFALWGGLVSAEPPPLRALHERGVVGFKAFMSDSGVAEFPALADDALADALRAAASVGALVAVHAEDQTMTRDGRQRLRADGRRDPGAWSASRPAEAEVRAIERLGAAARRAGGRVHVVHASCAAAVDAVVRERERGADMTVETCPHYLVFDDADLRRVGPALKCAPPLRDVPAREVLWQRLGDGAIDLVASDHSPCAAELKRRGDDDIWLAWGGIAGIQSTLPALLTEGVHRRSLSLSALARISAESPARRCGLAGKGAIRVGADADLAIVDPERDWTLAEDDVQSRAGLSPYVGRRFHGAVVRTVVRGRVVWDEGAFPASPGWGRFVRRSG